MILNLWMFQRVIYIEITLRTIRTLRTFNNDNNDNNVKNDNNERNIMKKIIALAFAIILGAGTMSAQRGGGHQRMSVDDRVANMAKELILTEKQQKQITAIYKESRAKRTEGTRPTREEMRAEMETVNQKVNAVLTDEQRKKFEKMNKARQNRRR